jgi:hypothetical protein
MRSVTGSSFFSFVSGFLSHPRWFDFAWTVWVDGLGLVVRDYCRDAGEFYLLFRYRPRKG